MAFRIVLLTLVAWASVSAQLVVKNHASGQALASAYILPDAPTNDSEQLVLDVVNTGTAPITVGSVVVFGQYYSICCVTSFTLAPAAVQTLTLSFSPQSTGYSSGSLQLDGQVILLFGQGVAAASLFLQTAAGTVQAHAGTPLVFTSDPPSRAQITCLLEASGSEPITISSLGVTGGWAISGAPSLPFTLPAGQKTTFALQVNATAADGSVEGVIAVNQWSYAIVAEPAQPTVQIQVPSPLLKSGVQSTVAIAFNPPPSAASTGTIQLTFEAATSTALADPAIIFTSNGTNSIDFTSSPEHAAASFNGVENATFQTGTTAGTIHITVKWGTATVTYNVHVLPEPIALDTVLTKREQNALDVTITGFDNTRTAGRVSFSFFDSKGAFIGNPVTADFTSLFYSYFFQTEYNAGGMFKMVAHFPVVGNPGAVASVQVDLMNSAGDAQSSVTKF